jgi:hypothetical protein
MKEDFATRTYGYDYTSFYLTILQSKAREFPTIQQTVRLNMST